MGSCLSGTGASPPPPPPPYASSSSSCNCYQSSGSGDATTSYSSSSGIEMRLHRVPGRLFLNGSSDVASLFCKQGRKGINQDAMLLWDVLVFCLLIFEFDYPSLQPSSLYFLLPVHHLIFLLLCQKFCSMDDTVFCGVFDGHGPFGHVVAKKVRDSFPLKLIAEWNLHPPPPDKDIDHHSCKSDDCNNHQNAAFNCKVSNFGTLMRESFVKACKVMDKELKLHHHIDCYCSGTTAVTLIKQGQHLVIANVGDSRAVLGSRDQHGSIIAVQLTTDLKPNLPREAERIRICEGRVFSLENEPGVARVWLPNVDSPGLAMARAFGDFCLKDYGVISVPDVSYHRLTEKDDFVVLATDGVWDVLSNQQVVDIVASAPRSSAARELVESAVQAWRTKLPTSKPDDCSVVCLFFHSPNTIHNLIP